jgi:hypothetical protein
MVPSPMENSMCWEMDYRFFAEQKKAQETRIKEEQRAGVIDKLLSEANKKRKHQRNAGQRGRACKVDRLRLTEPV